MAVRIARWCFTLLGGLFLGAGLLLHGLIAVAFRMIGRVDETFFLWRAVGRATIFMLGGDRRVALALKEVPPDVLDECSRSAWMMVVVGTLLAITGPFLRGAVARPASTVTRRSAPRSPPSAPKPSKPPKPARPRAAVSP